MTAQPARNRIKALALAACGIAVIATAAYATSASAAQSGRSAASAGQQHAQAVASTPVVVNCSMKTQVRPGSYTLACADGNAYVSGLSWSAWGSSSALASGNYAFNDCTPNCLSGHGHTFSGLVVLWGVKSLPGHAGVRYFTEMTIILTGNRSYTAGGKKVTESQTQTIPLSNFGGA
ncbi:MAG TPA: hypothetical protein VN840_09470 [Streptosporangiaceae bacterium]|nr:hypothetical protein [Streptosporangiaceae bacterium]